MSTAERFHALGIKPPTPSDQVYRDDCVYCFDTPESPHGLDVCLLCLQASSPDPAHDYTKLHFQLTRHPVFVNIKKISKSRTRDHESPPKIQKLAIEADREEDRFDTVTKVKDVELGTELDGNLDYVQQVVQSILNSTSYSRRQEIQAWEQEVVPCEHVLKLEQDNQVSLQNLNQCTKCDLQENLWLCLVCGNVGCGRAQFGGVGGNGHGLEHYEATGHQVSVKLGSITPEGSADAFCYVHSDEVLDPNLVQHLHHWGINVAEREKTEKSLTELQLEQNLKWDFSLTAGDGSELEPLFGPGLTGLKNLGNSCYISSVVQCLFDIPYFQKRYHQSNMEQQTRQPAQDLEVQMRKIADGLLSGRYAVPDESAPSDNQVLYQKGLSLGMLKALIGKGHEEFSTMRQQDAFEFLIYILDKLSRDSKSKGLDDPTKVFQFQTEQRLECNNCHAVRYKVDDQENLSIPVPAHVIQAADGTSTYKPVAFEECLDSFVAPTSVEYNCKTCGSSELPATTSTRFKTFPEVLIVNAQRFKVLNWVPVKLNIAVDVPQGGIFFDKYLSAGPKPDETVVEGEDEDDSFVANEAALESLEAMGFPQVRCEKALYNTGNSDAEAAMNWLFQHMEDPDIDEPFLKGKGEPTISPEHISQLMEMGFSESSATQALRVKGSVEAALEHLFANPNLETATIAETSVAAGAVRGDSTLPAQYRLKSIICHKGGSVHAGHYVAFVQKEVDGKQQWVLFNDEKVVKGGEVEEMKKYAYVYFFGRVR